MRSTRIERATRDRVHLIAMTEGPLARYRALVDDGSLKPDPAQALAAEKLNSLYHALQSYKPKSGRKGWMDRFGLLGQYGA